MRHVRDIQVNSGTISHSLLTELAVPLLPSLRRLDWVVPFKVTIQPFLPLVVPSLTAVHVDVSLDCSPLLDAEFLATLLDGLNIIARRCASLTTLEILWIYGSLLSCSAAVLDALSSLLSLKALSATTNVITSRHIFSSTCTQPGARYGERPAVDKHPTPTPARGAHRDPPGRHTRRVCVHAGGLGAALLGGHTQLAEPCCLVFLLSITLDVLRSRNACFLLLMCIL